MTRGIGRPMISSTISMISETYTYQFSISSPPSFLCERSATGNHRNGYWYTLRHLARAQRAPLQRDVARDIFFALRHRADEPFVDHHKKKPCLSVAVQLENVNRWSKTADGHMVQDTISAPIPQAENAGNTSIREAICLFRPFRLKKKSRGDFSLRFKSLYSAGFPTQSACLRAPRLVQ